MAPSLLYAGLACLLVSTTTALSWGKNPQNEGEQPAALVAKVETLSDRPCPYSFTLFPNGAAANGVSAILPENAPSMTSGELAAWAAAQVYDHHQQDPKVKGGSGDEEGVQPCTQCALFDASARQITHCSQMVAGGESSSFVPPPYSSSSSSSSLLSAGEKKEEGGGDLEPELWVAEPGRWFVYPAGELGRAVKIPRVKPPRGDEKPITVETIRLLGAPIG